MRDGLAGKGERGKGKGERGKGKEVEAEEEVMRSKLGCPPRVADVPQIFGSEVRHVRDSLRRS